MSIESITPFMLSPSSLLSPLEERFGARQLGAHLTATIASSNLAGRLTVITAEGDKVTLNTTLTQHVESLTYHHTVKQASTTLDMGAKETLYVLEQKLGMTVEGHLNEQEARDLLMLFEKVLDLFRTFVREQDETAVTTMAMLTHRFDSLSTLSSLDLTVIAERSLMMLTVSESPARSEHVLAPDVTAVPEAIRATIDATPSTITAASPSSDSEAPAELSVSSGLTDQRNDLRLAGLFSLDNRSLALVDQLLETVNQSSLEPNMLLKFLPRLLDRVRGELNIELNRTALAKETSAANSR